MPFFIKMIIAFTIFLNILTIIQYRQLANDLAVLNARYATIVMQTSDSLTHERQVSILYSRPLIENYAQLMALTKTTNTDSTKK